MVYTQESFEKWLEEIPAKLKLITEDFAKGQGLKLDFSIKSLDALEKWMISYFDIASDLRDEEEYHDLLSLYVGETYMKHIGGEWHVDFANEKSIYYQELVMKNVDADGDVSYRSARALCTSCISRKKGNLISSTLKKSMNK